MLQDFLNIMMQEDAKSEQLAERVICSETQSTEAENRSVAAVRRVGVLERRAAYLESRTGFGYPPRVVKQESDESE